MCVEICTDTFPNLKKKNEKNNARRKQNRCVGRGLRGPTDRAIYFLGKMMEGSIQNFMAITRRFKIKGARRKTYGQWYPSADDFDKEETVRTTSVDAGAELINKTNLASEIIGTPDCTWKYNPDTGLVELPRNLNSKNCDYTDMPGLEPGTYSSVKRQRRMIQEGATNVLFRIYDDTMKKA